MGSAPVRRSWSTRMASSARRGAYVANGVSGARRVTPSRGSSAGTLATTTGGGGGDPTDWTEIVNGWVWDAGLYLGADFEDTDGYPLDMGGADDIRFLVLPPGSDTHVYATNDPLTQEPCSQATFSGGSHLFFEIPDPSTPDADSHLWVYWYGPDFDPATDTPPAVTPASLVPAALAANGEA